MVLAILPCWMLHYMNDNHQIFVVLDCNSSMLPPCDYNLTTCMWRWMANSQILKLKMFKFFILVELVISMVFGSVEDERTLFTLTFMKSKLTNQLTTNLDLIAKMYVQNFFSLQSFLVYTTIIEWSEKKSCYGLEL